jgi:hypothetical protein
MVCSIVQSGTKFVSSGCPNCEEFLEMRHNADVVQDCTSAVFEGMIGRSREQLGGQVATPAGLRTRHICGEG